MNPWNSRAFAKEPFKSKIRCDPSNKVNPLIKIPNAAPGKEMIKEEGEGTRGNLRDRKE